MSARNGLRAVPVLVSACLLAACQSTPTTPSISQLYQRPAERALVDGMRLYESGEFERAESSLRTAVSAGLADRRDAAVGYKYLAFIACAFNRATECALDFADAFGADPGFRLNDVEIGHPLWGPVYRRVAQAMGHADNRAGSARQEQSTGGR